MRRLASVLFSAALLAGCSSSTDQPQVGLGGLSQPSVVVPTIQPTPKPTKAPAPLPVTRTGLTTRVRPGASATVSIRTLAGSACDIVVSYDSGPSTAAGLVGRKASSAGFLRWTWKVGTRTYPGTYPIDITCSKDARSGSLELQFTVT